MRFSFRSLLKVGGSLAFVAAMVLSLSVAANAQRHDRHEWRDMRGYQNQQRHDFRHAQRDLRRYNGGYNNGYYDAYRYRQYNNGYPYGYYGNNGYYNNQGYYDPYNRGYYGNRRYYGPHIDSRNRFKRTIHHLFGGH
ncbi:MAG TPA: hypothetical protein VJS64_14035 [Pyrinomonadaceae bacterium]|jgi:hypothetical protein|nr:hypothetical protein [Pyrinomonadaceae bacterium]